jgi:hypothetical protein
VSAGESDQQDTNLASESAVLIPVEWHGRLEVVPKLAEAPRYVQGVVSRLLHEGPYLRRDSASYQADWPHGCPDFEEDSGYVHLRRQQVVEPSLHLAFLVRGGGQVLVDTGSQASVSQQLLAELAQLLVLQRQLVAARSDGSVVGHLDAVFQHFGFDFGHEQVGVVLVPLAQQPHWYS